MRPVGISIPQLGLVKPAFVRYQHQLISEYGALAVLLTRPPVGEEGEEVECADGARAFNTGDSKKTGCQLGAR